MPPTYHHTIVTPSVNSFFREISIEKKELEKIRKRSLSIRVYYYILLSKKIVKKGNTSTKNMNKTAGIHPIISTNHYEPPITLKCLQTILQNVI